MIRARKDRGSYSQSEPETCCETRALAALPLVVMFVCLSACAHRDPQAAFDHARETLRKGDTATAASEAEKGYKDFHTASPEWAWKFTILRVWMLHLRGVNDQALKLLSTEPAPPPSGELAVQKLRWRASLTLPCIGSRRQMRRSGKPSGSAQLLTLASVRMWSGRGGSWKWIAVAMHRGRPSLRVF